MRYIEDVEIRDKHKDEEFWMIGAGLSLDDFPKGFFKDKLSIAINWGRMAFPECTYSHHLHATKYMDGMLSQKDEVEVLFKQCILVGGTSALGTFWREWPIYMPSKGQVFKEEELAKNVRQIMEKKPCDFTQFGNTLHTGIEAALVLGANEIILVGCEHKYPETMENKEVHARCLADYYPGWNDIGFHDAPNSWADWHRRGTLCLAREMKKHGIMMWRYYYGKEYEDVTEVQEGVVRYIEDLRDRHKDKRLNVYNKNIWILGCSPWLDDYPDDFFDDKISIRLNYSMVAFPVKKDYHYAHWYCSEWREVVDGKKMPGIREYVDKNVPEIYDRVMLDVPHQRVKTPEMYGKNHEKIIWIKYDEVFARKKEEFRVVVRAILHDKVECRFRSLGSVLHTAIQAALVMGAKRVVLAGCEAKSTTYFDHAQKRGMAEFYRTTEGPTVDKRELWHIEGLKKPEKPIKEPIMEYSLESQQGTTTVKERYKNGTKWIAEEASLYGREIVRHSYKKGYEAVI